MSSGSLYSNTLQTITNAKLEELSKKRTEFELQREALLARAEAAEDSLSRLTLLVDGCKDCFNLKVNRSSESSNVRRGPVDIGGSQYGSLEVDIANIDRFLEQARFDPSLTSKVDHDWPACLIRHLDVQSLRFQYADLYAKLVTEWLTSDQASAKADGQDVSMSESFEEVPGAKKLESRAMWEKAVFESADVDVMSLKHYLVALFGVSDPKRKEEVKSLQSLRGTVHDFEMELARPGQFSQVTLAWTIEGLVASDLLSNEKRAVLRDFARNPVILAEIADVLNMRLTGLTSWTWGDEVPVEQRRQLRGAYSIFMHEDLLQAIFLHYLGNKWSVFWKSALIRFRDIGVAWKSNSTDIPGIDKAKREFYLGSQSRTTNSLQVARRNIHQGTYFSFQLLDHDRQKFEADEGEEEAEFRNDEFDDDNDDTGSDKRKRRRISPMRSQQMMPPMQVQQTFQAQQKMARQQSMQMQQMQSANHGRRVQLASKASRKSAPVNVHLDTYSSGEDEETDDYDSDSQVDGMVKNPIKAKQRLLHLLSAEVTINRFLHGELTCLRSVFDQLYSGMPQVTVITILEFFGVSKDWINFFKKFLAAPLKFMDESVEPRLRRRGMPGSHALSDFFGEAVLFCLDYSVNRNTDGALLYRLQDDFWFWSASQAKVVKAWAAVTEFTTVTGLNLNSNKTGSVRIADEARKSSDIDSRLPRGQIRWGFLVMDAQSGRFTIDQKMIENHIRELKVQLQGKSKSVFDWVSAYNAYAATFFSSNLGKAANCFGRAHVDEMLAAHRHVQQSIFESGSAVDFLKNMIHDRFGVENIPDGFLFFPVELGGLDLKSPFIQVMQIRDSVRSDPEELLKKYQEAEVTEYLRLKKEYEARDSSYAHPELPRTNWRPTGNSSEFISFEDFIQYREDIPTVRGADSLRQVYRTLLDTPAEVSIDVSAHVMQTLAPLSQINSKTITGRWNDMEAYWKWVTVLYGPDIIARFDGLSIVDAKLLPIGMVSFFRERRIKWQE